MDLTKYDGVAFQSDGSASQLSVINELAGRARLVTLGDDVEGSKRLCHVAFSEFENGREIARIVREASASSNWKILLVNSTSESDIDADGNVRLRGFQLEWDVIEQLGKTSTLRIFRFQGSQSESSLMEDLAAVTADPDLDAIVAFDPHAADSALATLAGRARARHIPVFVFEPTADILAAIEDGRVECAISNDPYFCGYEAVRRLAIYAPKPMNQLPIAGRGEQYLVGEIITRANLRDARHPIQN
jgi:ABC-type sugar transport system substrate-binding protein